MGFDRIERVLSADLEARTQAGRRKQAEAVIVGVLPAEAERGPRFLLAGEGDRPFLRMNANGYLGLGHDPDVIAAEERASRAFGVGPEAVRFISGTFAPHVELEAKLARFHDREAAMIYSSAYAAVMGILPQLIDDQTAVLSDELNHNCIINAIRLSEPRFKRVYPHLDMDALEAGLEQAAETCDRAIVVTDGVFSMRGDHAPLDRIIALAQAFDARFSQNVIVVVDDSHGVGALGESGRGVEQVTGARADILIATLGKALGVNGGYVVGSATLVEFLRETSPFYIYSNPITPGEAAAASCSLEILDSAEGRRRIAHVHAMTERFREGLARLGHETLRGEHPVVPLMVREATRTRALVRHLRSCGVLATGLHFPVVPEGEDKIRFQISSDHTPYDIDEALAALASFPVEG
ncbi:MAG: aminotransferase class I/II-fold pyridoxal phosphate-dependent enzyme [Deltaproteobacteria bacterium]|nr:aminotransferase class I/II-fold pyridoxal phosphate-dependent enzyme [Deltaproteobacteria bacterium]